MENIVTTCKKVKLTKTAEAELPDKLRSWTELNLNLPLMSSKEVARAIHLELQGRNRWPVLRRLLGRLNRLTLNEDLETLEVASKKKKKRG
jgi:hypothetical protein